MNRYAKHVQDLADAFHIALLIAPELPPHAAAAGPVAFVLADETIHVNAVIIAPVIDESTYAVALHELGHHLAPLGRVASLEGSLSMRMHKQPATLRDVRLQLLEERSAWEWAHHYALEWTPLMDYVESLGIASYVNNAKRYGVL